MPENVRGDAEGELLGVAEDDNGARVYWFDFDGEHYSFGGDEPGQDQGVPDDGDFSFVELRRFHRGRVRNDAESPYR